MWIILINKIKVFNGIYSFKKEEIFPIVEDFTDDFGNTIIKKFFSKKEVINFSNNHFLCENNRCILLNIKTLEVLVKN